MPDVFISFSSKDERLARFVQDHLIAGGVSVFLAPASLHPRGGMVTPDIKCVERIELGNLPGKSRSVRIVLGAAGTRSRNRDAKEARSNCVGHGSERTSRVDGTTSAY